MASAGLLLMRQGPCGLPALFGPSVLADFCADADLRGKLDHLHRTPAEFTTPTHHGSGLRNQLLARPAGQASYPVLVHRVAALLHASSGPRLAAMPLRFASPSTPSVWAEDSHLQAVEHARHTTQTPLVHERGHANWPAQRPIRLAGPPVRPDRSGAAGFRCRAVELRSNLDTPRRHRAYAKTPRHP